LEDIEWGFNFVVDNAKIVDLEVDWLFLSEKTKFFRTLNYPLKVDDHELLVDIAEMLHKIMKVDPSLFGFCMFSFLPDEILKMIIEAHVKNKGGLNCRAVNKKWHNIATNEEYFPGLKDRDLVGVSIAEWTFFKYLYGVNLGEGELHIDYLDSGRNKVANLVYDRGLLFEKFDQDMNFLYPSEVQRIRFSDPGAIAKALKMHKMGYVYARTIAGKFGKKHESDPLMVFLGMTSWQGFGDWKPHKTMMENSRIRRFVCDLYRKHVLQMK
jgi:hypothetical protein